MRKPLIILGIILFFSLFSFNARADITNLSYKFPVDTNATTANLVFSVNDTYGLGGNILWTQNKAGLYAYCSVIDCSSGVMGIGNLTSELNWENESSGLGSNPTDVWESSLVAVYHFGNGLNDSTANNNDAGYRDISTASFIPGVFGNAIDFNPAVVGYDGSGTNGLALPSSITDDLWISTIEFWYMPNDSTSDYQGMLGIFGDSSNKFQLFYGITDGKINVYFKVGGAVKIPSVDIATTLTAGQWYHIAIVFDSTDFKLYVNGSLADGLTYACTNLLKDIAPSADTTFGSVYDGAYYNAKGAFDEIKLYNRSLSETEVQEHYYNGLPDNLTDVSTTPPAIFSVDLVSPSNGYALPSNLTAIYSYIPTSNVSLTKCMLLNNDTSWSMKQENQSVIANDTVNTITYVHSSYGWYEWNVNCTDSEGKEVMATTNFTYHLTDSVPPSVSLSFPSNGAVVVKGVINFTYIPTDNWGFYKAELSMNGTVYETVTISDNARFSTYYNTPFPYMYDMYPEAYHYEGVYNRTYFVWSAGSVYTYPMIRYYDHTSKTFSPEYNISTVAPASSDYSEPVIQINGSGYIFIEYRNESERTMAYYVSDNPEDITAFTHIGIVATEGGYPQFHKFDNGTFYMLFAYKRDVVTGQTDEGEILSYDNIHWTDARVILNCTTEYYPYGTAFHGTSYMDSDNNIYEVWGVNRGGAEEFWDESLMYAYRTYNDSNWRNFTGDIQPINENESMKCGNIVVYNSSLTSDPVHIVRGVVKLDSIKRPNIVFYGMRDGGRNESYWHTGYNGTEWVTTLITNVSNSEFTNGVSDSIVYYEINSTDGQEVYLPLSQSATYGAGVLVKYFSTDNGTTWIFDKVIDGNISGIPKDIYNGTASGMKFVYGIGTSEETSQAKLYGLNFPAWKKVASNASAITNDSVNTISYSVDVSGDYVWNVNITDLYGNSVFATGNYTLYVVDSIPPLPSGCLNSTFSYARNLTIANADSQRINELTGIYVSDLCNPRSDCASDLHDVRLYEDGVQKDWQCFNENNYTRCDSPDAVMIRFLANADTSGIYNNYQFCFNASVDNDTGYDTNLGIYWEDNFENRTSGFSKWNSGVLTAGAGTVTINTTGGYSYLSSHSAEMKGGTSNYAQLHTEGDTKTQGRIQFFMKNLIPLSSSYNNLLIIVNDGGWSDWGWLGMVNEAFPNAVTGMATNGSSIIWHSGGHSEYVSPVSCDGVWCLYTLETNSSGSFMWVNQTVLVSSAPYLTSWDTDLYFSTGASGGYGEDDFLIDDFMWTDSGTVVNRYLTPAVVAVGAKEGALPEYPIVILNQPSNGGTFSNSFIVPLNFTVTSNTSITGCDVLSNKTGSWAYLASNSSAILNDTMMTVNGTFTSIGAIQWAVNCTDSNGNKRASSNYTFTIIDTQSPYEVNLVSPADGSSTNDTTPDFTFNFIDNMSPTGSATLYLNDTSDGFTTIAPTLKGMSAMNRNIPCINSSATNWQTKCYYFGGHNGTSTVESFVINISDGAWYHIADYPNAITGLNSMPMVDGERILVEYDDTTQHYTNIYYILNDSYHALPNVPVTGSPGCANNENSIAFRGKDLNISSEYDDLYYYVGGGGYNGCDEMHIWNDTDSTWLTGDDIDLDGLVGIEASSYFVANHTVYSIGGTGHNSSGGGSDQDWGCIKWTPITPINGTWAHCTDPPADYENKFINNYFGYYADKFHLFGGYNRSQSANGIHDSWWKHLVFYWQNETYEVARNNTFALGGGVSANLGDGTFIFAMNYNAIGGYFDYNTTAFEYVSSDFDIWVDYGSNSSVLNATNTAITANQNLTFGKTYKWYVEVTDESGNENQSSTRTFTVTSLYPPINVSGFLYHKIINITYPDNATADYILTLKLNSTDMNYTLSDGTLLFTTMNETTDLNYFRESWDYGAGNISEIMVKVPQSVTSIIMWYGNTTTMSGKALSNAIETFIKADTGDVGLNGISQTDNKGVVNDGGWSHRQGEESVGYNYIYTSLQAYGDSALGITNNGTSTESIIIPADVTTLQYRFYDNGSTAQHYAGAVFLLDNGGINGAEIAVSILIINSSDNYIYEFIDKSRVDSGIPRTTGWHKAKVVYDIASEHDDGGLKGSVYIWLDDVFVASSYGTWGVYSGHPIGITLAICDSLGILCNTTESMFWDNVLLYNSTTTEPTYLMSEPSLENPPQITYVESISPVNPTEGATTAFTINFTAYDMDGVGDLNLSSHSMTITGETNPAVTRTDTSCYNYMNTTNTASFTCTFSLNYYNDPQNYRINASIYDNEATSGYNDSISFTYNELKAWTMSPSSITYGSLNCGIGAPQGATDDPMVLNNTGNANITNITVKAYDLIGQSDGSWIINSSYFTVNTVDSSGGDVMLNDTYVQIASSKIPFGQGSTESLFYWIEALPCPLKGQSYQSTWEISGA